MKSEKNILIAFILNFAFSIFELFGGIMTNSVAIISDSIHDIGDAISIGISYFLEKKSKKQPDKIYTYGYARYSVIGSVITVMILLVGSILVIVNAINRIINPQEINYNGMIVFAIVGVVVNFLAAFFTRNGDSLNQKAVNLHMIEDVLGWVVVLIGAIVMRFTDWRSIDPILSICVAAYVFIHAFSHLKDALDLFLVKIPEGLKVDEIKRHVCEIDGVLGAHHIHIWSMDGTQSYATMHIVTNGDGAEIKKMVKDKLREHGIGHVTLELESKDERCIEKQCYIQKCCCGHFHHNHSHHHHH